MQKIGGLGKPWERINSRYYPFGGCKKKEGVRDGHGGLWERVKVWVMLKKKT